MDMDAFGHFGTDKQGRTNIYMKLCNYLPEKASVELTAKAIYMFFQTTLKFTPNIDKMNIVLDLKNLGMKNLDSAKMKVIFALCDQVFIGNFKYFFIVNMSTLPKLVYSMA